MTSTRKRPPKTGPMFRPGELVGERFRVVRFIAAGGMGEVYEVEDLELGERVALKTISADRLADADSVERFRREVQIARKITHPNVCRTFDVFRTTGSRRDVTFVTMELLGGETLSDRLRRERRLPITLADEIARQAGAGLEAAHAAGVIHRDIKSGNIVLVPTRDGVRAVVTDFGVATNVLTSGTTGVLTEPNQMIGTPAYMAPEQIAGRPANVLSDIYAFGIVLYEMVCGTLPFEAETPVAAALMRLSERPTDPTVHAPDLPERWTAAIRRCLARDPVERFATVKELVDALTGEENVVLSGGHRAPSRWAAGALAVLAIAAVGTVSYVLPRWRRSSTQLVETSAARRTVALLGFRNLAADPQADYMSIALSEGIGTELGSSAGLRTVAGESVTRMRLELGISASETLGKDTLQRVRRNLTTDLVVLGSYLVQPGSSSRHINLFVNVQSTESGELVTSFRREGNERDLGTLIAETGAELRSRLVGAAERVEATTAVRTTLPTETQVTRLYFEGLDALRKFDARRARDLLERAVALQPDFPLAHSALSAAWAELGYDAQATREAASALQLAEKLPAAERQWIEALYRETTREWDRAITIYESLRSSDPGNIEYGLRLAAAQISAGRPADARATSEVLRRQTTDPDPRVFLTEASAAGAAGEYETQQKAAGAAVKAAQNHGATLLAARALIDKSGALLQLRQLPDAAAASEESRRIYQDAGDRRGVARALIQLGNVYRAQRKFSFAEKHLREAVEIGRDLGNRRHTARALNDLANVYFDQQRYQSAAQIYDEVLKIAREVGDRYTESRALNNLASARYELGDIPAARRLDEQALAIQRELGNRSRIAFSLINMGETASDTGDLEGAQKLYEEAVAINRDLRDRGEEAYALAGLARVLCRRGKITEARSTAGQALAIRRELDDDAGVAESTVDAAAITAAAGDTERAIEMLQSALLPGSEVEQDPRVRASAILVGLLLDRRGVPDAVTVYKSDLADADLSSLSHGTRVVAEIATGRLRWETGEREADERIVRGAVARSRKLQLRAYELEAMLMLARFELVANSVAGRAELGRVESEARRLGFFTIAETAARLKRST